MRDGWANRPLSSVAIRVTAKNKNLINEVFTVSAEHGLIEQEKFFNKRVASKNLLGYTVVQPGMLVYNKSYSANAAYGVITRNHHDYSGVVSPLYIVFEPKEDKVLGKYLELATNSSLFFSSLQKFIKEGGRAHGGITVSLGDFFDCAIPIPSLTEQKRIVDVVSSVDAYIDALQQQADSARTARNAVLHQLLSTGGDDWTKSTLGDVSHVIMGRQLSPSMRLGTRPRQYLRAANIGNWGINLDDVLEMDFTEQEERHFAIKVGDVLMVEGGSEKSVGCPALVSEREEGLCIQNTIIRCRIKEVSQLTPEFLYHFLRYNFWTGKFGELCAGTTIMHLGQKRAVVFPLVLPPLSEQKRIVEIVSSLDDVIQSTEKAVVDAKSLRSGLLSDLLSGDHEVPASYDSLLGAA